MLDKKIAIILGGFQSFYLEKLISLFVQDGYEIDFYSNNKAYQDHSNQSNFYYFESQINEKYPKLTEKLNAELEELMQNKNYTHVLSDCCPIRFGCNVFHKHSLEYRKILSPNFIYELIFALGHLEDLKYFKKWYTYSFLNCP